MRKRKEMLGIRIPYLVCVPRMELRRIAGLLGYFIDEQRPHAPLEVVARLPCCLATPVGLMLLTCELSPHSQ
jgi:hypothetical protein